MPAEIVSINVSAGSTADINLPTADEPAFIIPLLIGLTGTTGETQSSASDAHWSIGAATGATGERCLCTFDEDGNGTSDADTRLRDGALIEMSNGTRSTDGELGVKTWPTGAGNIVLNIGNAFPSSFRITFLIVHTDICTNATILDITESGSNGNVDYTGVGADDTNFIMALGNGESSLNWRAHARFTLGFGAENGGTWRGFSLAGGAENNQGTSDTETIFTDPTARQICTRPGTNFGSTVARFTIETAITDGVRLNWLQRNTTNRRYKLLCATISDVEIVDGSTPASDTGTFSLTTAFQAQAGMAFASEQNSYDASTGRHDEDVRMIGFFDDTIDQVAHGLWSEHGVGTTAVNLRRTDAGLLAYPSGTGTSWRADLDAINATSIDFSMAASEATQRKMIVLLFGGGDVGATTITETANLSALIEKQGILSRARLEGLVEKQGISTSAAMTAMLEQHGLVAAANLSAVLERLLTANVNLTGLIETQGDVAAQLTGLLERQDISAAVRLDALLVLVGMSSVNMTALVQALDVQTATKLTALVEQQGLVVSANLDALLALNMVTTANLDALVERGLTANILLTALVEAAGITTTVDLTGLIQRDDIQTAARFDALLAVGRATTAELTALVQDTITTAAKLDALLERNLDVSANLTGILVLQGAEQMAVKLTALVERLGLETATRLTGLVEQPDLTTAAELTAIVAARRTANVSLTALAEKTRTLGLNLSAAIQLQDRTIASQLDARVQKQLTTAALLTAIVELGLVTRTANVQLGSLVKLTGQSVGALLTAVISGQVGGAEANKICAAFARDFVGTANSRIFTCRPGSRGFVS